MSVMEWDFGKSKWAKHCPTCAKTYEVDGDKWNDGIKNMYEFFCHHDNHSLDSLHGHCRECANNKWSKRTGTRTKQEMFDEQNGLCAICETEVTLKNFKIDHCYKTGKTRALLCHRCNTRMAPVDEEEWLQKAILYRDKYKEINQ